MESVKLSRVVFTCPVNNVQVSTSDPLITVEPDGIFIRCRSCERYHKIDT
jgi:transcription elongation factor Elf1